MPKPWLKELPDYDFGYLFINRETSPFGIQSADVLEHLVEQVNERSRKVKYPIKYAVLFSPERDAYLFKWAPIHMTAEQFTAAVGPIR